VKPSMAVKPLSVTPPVGASSSLSSCDSLADTDTKMTGDDKIKNDLKLRKLRTGKVVKLTKASSDTSVIARKVADKEIHKKPIQRRLNKTTYKLSTAAKLLKVARKGKPREPICSYMFMNELPWSKWKLAYSGTEPFHGKWQPRGEGHPGFFNSNLYRHDTQAPAFYELAVQTQSGKHMHPVWNSITKGFNSLHMNTYLKKNTRVQKQIDDVIQKGSKLYIRRAKVQTPAKLYVDEVVGIKQINSVDELRLLINNVYDYAWGMFQKTSHRHLVKSGVVISDSTFS
jgi:hypothetical protein